MSILRNGNVAVSYLMVKSPSVWRVRVRKLLERPEMCIGVCHILWSYTGTTAELRYTRCNHERLGECQGRHNTIKEAVPFTIRSGDQPHLVWSSRKPLSHATCRKLRTWATLYGNMTTVLSTHVPKVFP